jgi:hypothetical protein
MGTPVGRLTLARRELPVDAAHPVRMAILIDAQIFELELA